MHKYMRERDLIMRETLGHYVCITQTISKRTSQKEMWRKFLPSARNLLEYIRIKE